MKMLKGHFRALLLHPSFFQFCDLVCFLWTKVGHLEEQKGATNSLEDFVSRTLADWALSRRRLQSNATADQESPGRV